VRDELARIEGVGQASCSAPATTRCACGSTRTRSRRASLTAGDIIGAIREQNVQVSAGTIGGPPHPDSAMQFSINAQGRLNTVEEFGEIVLKAGADGEITRLKRRRAHRARRQQLHDQFAAEQPERRGDRDLPGAGRQHHRALRRHPREDGRAAARASRRASSGA
jgi:hypothetical protein